MATRRIQLSEATGGGQEARFCADGVRVSREKCDMLKRVALRLECLSTRGAERPGGKIRRYNYSVAVMPSWWQ